MAEKAPFQKFFRNCSQNNIAKNFGLNTLYDLNLKSSIKPKGSSKYINKVV